MRNLILKGEFIMMEFVVFVLVMLFVQFAAVVMVAAACYVVLCKSKTMEVKRITNNTVIDERES